MNKGKEELENEVPFINDVKELKPYISSLYIVTDYMESKEKYEAFIDRIYNIVKGCFTIKECRTYPIKFKFYKEDTATHKLELRMFLINLFAWYPFISLYGVPNALGEYFIIKKADELITIEDYINYKIIVTLRNYNVKDTLINEYTSEVLHYMSSICLNFSVIMNLNFSYFTFKEIYDKHPELREIMECKLSDDMQPKDIEEFMDQNQKTLIDVLKNDPDNPIGMILKCRTGIKDKQLTEFSIAQSLKPTLDGKIIPIPIENSTLIRGLDRPSYLYIDAMGARKSLVMNKTVMGRAGYFSKMTLELLRTLGLSTRVSDCDTKHLLKFYVKNKKLLQKINYRYYKFTPDPDANEQLKMVDAKKDKDLVGKIIYMRSPVTCALGDCVCAKCFGRTSALNFGIAAGLPAFESEEITKGLQQDILSSKHLLTTNSEVLEFNAEFDKFFTVSSGEIYPNVDNNEDIENIEDYAIYVTPDSIEREEDFDNDSEFNTYIRGGMFYVTNMKTKEMIPIELKNDKQIFITDDARELAKSGRGYIKYKDMADNIMLFRIDIDNNELTKPLYDLMKILKSKAVFTDDGNYDYEYEAMAQKLVDILVESKIPASAVAAECILNRLLRSVEHPYERPNFSQYDLEEYEIYTVPKAIEHNASPLLGLCVQYLKRQLLSDELVTSKTGSSYLDHFINPKVSNLYDLYNAQFKGRTKGEMIGLVMEENDRLPLVSPDTK